MPSTQATTPEPSESTGMAVPAGAGSQPPARAELAARDAEKREALIRIAAYSFYERRGYVSGHELEDWLLAEMEVDRQSSGAQVTKQAN